jgi:acetyl-CoA carboxylase alpha subunit
MLFDNLLDAPYQNFDKDNIYRNFGMAHPEGYRKALRLMKQAEKFNRPIFTFHVVVQ